MRKEERRKLGENKGLSTQGRRQEGRRKEDWKGIGGFMRKRERARDR